MTAESRSISWRRRALALVSLAAGVCLIAAFVVFLTRHGNHLAASLIGLAVAAAGGWWLISQRGWRRSIGVVVVAVGAAIMGAAVGRAVSAADQPLLRALLVLGLLAVSVGSARLAMIRDHVTTHHAERPRHPVLICNPWSGGGKVEKFGLVELAQELGVETIMLDHGLDLEQLARDAVARGADCLGMAGGDGSQALVASIAVEHDLPYVCVTAGTRNHFALDLGLDRNDPRHSLYAFRDAVDRRIDYATVNGRFFVNNVSLGAYATIVQQDEYREAKADVTKAMLPELLGQTDHPFDLQFTEPDGTEVDGAFVVQVSNNPYVMGASLDVSQRRRIDTGELGVFAITAETGRDAAKVITLTALGQRKRSRSWHEFETPSFQVRSRSGRAFAGVDGEALELDTPLEFRIHPRGLRLLMPEGNLEVAERRRARQISMGSVLSVARGIEPADEHRGD